MKIAIFGASGAAGMLLAERCLAAGYEVATLVRRSAVFAYAGRECGGRAGASESKRALQRKIELLRIQSG